MTVPRPRRRRPVKRKPWESTVISSQGGSRPWTRIVAEVVRREPVCWLRLPGVCTVKATQADHIYPRKTHPHLAKEMTNLRGVCGPCNRRRGALPHYRLPELRAELAKGRKPPKALRFFG